MVAIIIVQPLPLGDILFMQCMLKLAQLSHLRFKGITYLWIKYIEIISNIR